ncbi:helix-turn-helix domain-containing protein [Microbacterium sp. K24]|uniref:ArsR/SmtB family transcription factor n=1 Tax=Microbacterium sp. K24 TaxID=2305446 RepID=UPI00197BFDE5|nr:helix-turn-helix domain-containing protein [Microbacterium sp. K24]
MPGSTEIELGAIFRALADEHRRRVMAELAADKDDGERTCNSFNLPISKQTQTHHFRKLRDAGLICEIDYGNRKGIRLRRSEINERFPGLLDALAADADSR